ncbi:hypothetical protein FRC11_013972 [Ceratobasidium sp. 423]|nr:hypothetical protein FRC11_013972 [Ceratobasidium sp. 423]
MSTKKYILNDKNLSPESFGWTEAFETWAQRAKAHVSWKFTELAEGPNRWEATVEFQGHTIVGYGSNTKSAKTDAVKKIENAGILRL